MKTVKPSERLSATFPPDKPTALAFDMIFHATFTQPSNFSRLSKFQVNTRRVQCRSNHKQIENNGRCPSQTFIV